MGDDVTLLDAALREPLAELLSGRHGILGYYRPVSRELYFWLWGRIAGAEPFLYHAVNAATFAALLAILHALVRAWAGPRAALLAALGFVLFPPVGALLSWISCAQDLIALFWGSLALLLYQRGRRRWAGVAVLLAALSKETAAVIAPALVVMEWAGGAPAPARRRLARLAPAFAGLAAAAAIALAARATWPPGTAVSIWSPRQLALAGRLPVDFLRTWWPPGAAAGIAAAAASLPLALGLAALFAALAVPGRRAETRPDAGPAPSPPGESRRREPGDPPPPPVAPRGAAGVRGRGAAGRAGSGARRRREPARLARPARTGLRQRLAAIAGGERSAAAALATGAGLALLGMIPVGFILERWRGYFFSFSALGAAIVIGVLAARLPAGVARVLAAAGAVVAFGANAVYRPVETAAGPARHPHVNHAFFREQAALSGGLVAQLVPHCDSLRAVGRAVALGIPEDALFRSVLGPALRVECGDTVTRVRWPLGLDAAAAGGPLLAIGWDAASGIFTVGRAAEAERVSLGLELQAARRHREAAAAFGAAAAAAPGEPLHRYRRVSALAAAGERAAAAAEWRRAAAERALPEPGRLARGAPVRGVPPPGPAALAAARRALEEPGDAGAHAALGRELLQAGEPLLAAAELAVAHGLARDPAVLLELAGALEALGRPERAHDAYREVAESGASLALRGRAVRGLTRIEAAAPGR